MAKLTVLKHPLIQHKLTLIRDRNCGTRDFRAGVNELSRLLAFEASRNLPLKDVTIETPMGTAHCKQLAGKKTVIAPILRAGMGMVDGMLDLIPSAKVACIGMYRDEKTFEPHEYYVKVPDDLAERRIIVVDPMLATGGSAIDAVNALIKRGAKPANIQFVCLVAAPEGVTVFQNAHPQVPIFAAAEDDHLDHGYIFPGLGDAGDRLFGTK